MLSNSRPIRVSGAGLDEFFSLNPELDLLTFDFLRSEGSDCRWPKGLDSQGLRQQLMTYQRLLRIHPNGHVAEQLLKRGLDSAQAIASMSEIELVESHGDLFADAEEARRVHRRASGIRGQVTHLWANVHGAVAGSHARGMKGYNVSEEVVEFFTELPTYEDLFGPFELCDCEHCKSIFGPAAYFVDLMRIIDRYVTRPNAGTIPPHLTLESRRKGLFEIPLTCAATHDLVPYLQIVNEVLADRAAQETGSADVYRTLATAEYPFNLPANVPLDETRIYLDELGAPLAQVYRVFSPVPSPGAPPSIPVARESLRLSIEQFDLVVTPTTDPNRLKELYGLVDQGLASLDEERMFLLQTGLDRGALDRLLRDNLNDDELDHGLAHGFFINQPLPDSEYVRVTTDDAGKEVLVHLTPETLDRINRFVRLSRWSGIDFTELDWWLSSAGMTRIDPGAVQALAEQEQVRVLYGLPRIEAAALWSDMKTTGRGEERYPADLFDQVYNKPPQLQDEAPYRPKYAANPLFEDPVQEWRPDGTERIDQGFGRSRLMGALEWSDTELTEVGTFLFGTGATVPLDVPNLSKLYRISLLLGDLQLSVDELKRLLAMLGIPATGVFSRPDLARLKATAVWMKLNHLEVQELYDILGYSGDGEEAEPPIAYGDMKDVWVLAQPGLLGPGSFSAGVIPTEKSEQAFHRILSRPDQPWVKAVTAAYTQVLGVVPETALAVVLDPPTVEDLSFLSDDFDPAEIRIVAETLASTYAFQVQLVIGRFAELFSTTTDVLSGLLYYVAKASVSIPDLVDLLLTPVHECAEGPRGPGEECSAPNADWQRIVEVGGVLARVSAAAKAFDLDGEQMVAMADDPAVYGIENPLEPTLGTIRSLVSLNALSETFRVKKQRFLRYFAMPSDGACDTGKKSARLAKLTGWKQPQICRLAQYSGEGTAIYDTVDGVVRLKRGFDVLSRTGMDAFFVENLLALETLKVEPDGWPTYRTTAAAMPAVAAAKLAPTWDEVHDKAVAELNVAKRDALEWLVLWKLRLKSPVFTSPRQLYELLLIDVETSGCSETSRISEGIAAAQLYLQRARLQLELGVDRLPIPEVWWEWLLNYRVWEANRKIFLYPENYLVPSIRQSRTSLFKSLQDSLQQGNVTRERVDGAFREYLEGFTDLTTLTYVDAYRGVVDDGQEEPVDTTFLFARTRAEPYIYYYNTKEEDATWGEWRKIDVTIASRYITPIYAFSRLFVFWVELTPSSSSEITSTNGNAASKNQGVYSASIRYSFYGPAGSWAAPQTLCQDMVTYVTPSTTPFNEDSGYQLFNTENLYWHKVNAQRVTGDNLTGLPENTTPSEKVMILYGPFLENNVVGKELAVPQPPDPARAVDNEAKYLFDLNVYRRSLDVNQAVSGPTRGSIPLQRAWVLNQDLNLDFLMRSTEFMLLAENRSAGIPPVTRPKLDVALSALYVTSTFDALRTDYYGDYTSDISTAAQPRAVPEDAFESPGISAAASEGVWNDLTFHGVLVDGRPSASFSLNTDLSFLFGGAPPEVKAILVPVVQEILLVIRARGAVATKTSFEIPEVDASASKQVHYDLRAHSTLDEKNFVDPLLTSGSDLSFLFGGAPPEEKQLLVGQVRRVLFHHMGEPLLLGNAAKDLAMTIMVKNQPGSFIFNNGDEAFLVDPETVRLPTLGAHTRVSDISSEPKVFDYSFVTENIDPAASQEAFRQLQEEGVVGPDGQVSPSFGPLTDLSFLFPETPEPGRSMQISEVRARLLNLPSITALRYYFENEDLVVDERSFITGGIDAAASAEVFRQLQDHGVVGPDGVISKSFTRDEDLSYLFPDEDPVTRERLTEEVRRILLGYYASTWQRNLHDLELRFTRLTTGAVSKLVHKLFAGGVEALLALPNQQAPVVPEMPFDRYLPARRVIGPSQFDGAQVDFHGPYGLYYWELFFFAPQLIAASLLAERRFEEALDWLQFIFNPTSREQPLSAEEFVTPDITPAQAEEAYAQLKEEGVVTADDQVAQNFNSGTYLGFLWPEIPLGPVKSLMIREVRNVLLNHKLSRPAARYWQFQPFRDHTLQTLGEILTDEAQIRIYNNDPFDPFAVARLRIGSFEKAIFMQYLDNLIDWGDALFAQYTREGLTAAQMMYDYAYSLLGERPREAAPCPPQPPATFKLIRDKYQDQPGGIPQFLIYLENFLPHSELVAPELDGKPFTDIDPYFCVPENDKILTYWDKVDDRLFKIRNCLDLEGNPLKLPLFAPPIDPMALVQAAAAGRSSTSVVEQQSPAIPPYRFNQMLPHARMLVATVTQLGGSLLAALTSRDTEALARLQNSHELNLLNLTTRLREEQIESARLGLRGLEESKAVIDQRKAFYDELVTVGLLSGEQAELDFAFLSMLARSAGQILETASAIAYMVPNVGSPFAMTYGGQQTGASLAKWAAAAGVVSEIFDFSSQASGISAGYERREQEWKQEARQAELEATQVATDIEAARVQLQMAERELELHRRTIEQTQEIQSFLSTKFDSEELYVWMAGRISTLYYQAYKIALDAALATQSAYRWELNRDDNFINFGYWDGLRQGLLAGEGLEAAINQMERAYMHNNIRRLEIKKVISLAKLSPTELFRLRTTGECTFTFGEALFDFDFPGHYARQVRSVEIFLFGPDLELLTEFNAQLMQIRNDLVLKPSKDAVQFLLGDGGNEPPPTVRRNWQSRQQIALSSDRNPQGTVEDYVNYFDERYIPFEGTGAVSEWSLRVPKETNRFDLQEISEVEIVLAYTALPGGETFRREVEDLLKGRTYPGVLYLDLAEQFPGRWESFMGNHDNPNRQVLTFPVKASDLPANLQDVLLQSVEFRLDVGEEVQMPATSSFMRLTVGDGDPLPIPMNGRYGAVGNLNLAAGDFETTWKIVVDLAAIKADPALKALLDPEGFLDPAVFLNLELILSYAACVYGCSP